MSQQIGLLKTPENPIRLNRRPMALNAIWDEADKTLWLYDDYMQLGALQEVVAALSQLGAGDTLRVRINSYGGDAFAGLTLANILQTLPAQVITQVDGIAGSSAALVALSGRRLRMGEHAMLFIHRAWTNVTGANALQLQALAKELEKIDAEIVSIIQRKAGVSEEVAYQWLDGQADGTLFSAKEALAIGLADEVLVVSEGLRDYWRVIQRAFSPADYIPDNPPGGEGEGVEGEWERPRLEDFSEKAWDELTIEQRQEIAKYFGFAQSLDTFGDLKLPHHFPPNHPKQGKASLSGVRNALARLPLTEGLSEADQERVRRHLRAHLPEPEDIYREVLASALLAFMSTVR